MLEAPHLHLDAFEVGGAAEALIVKGTRGAAATVLEARVEVDRGGIRAEGHARHIRQHKVVVLPRPSVGDRSVLRLVDPVDERLAIAKVRSLADE